MAGADCQRPENREGLSAAGPDCPFSNAPGVLPEGTNGGKGSMLGHGHRPLGWLPGLFGSLIQLANYTQSKKKTKQTSNLPRTISVRACVRVSFQSG